MGIGTEDSVVRYGLIFTPRGPRPYVSTSLRSGRHQSLTPGQSVAFAVMFLLAIVVAAVIVVGVL